MRNTKQFSKNIWSLRENNLIKTEVNIMQLSMTEENINGYGHLLHVSKKEPVFDNNEFTFVADVMRFASEGSYTVGILTGHMREIKQEMVEKHGDTVEILVQLENDAVVFLGKPAPSGDEPGEIQAFEFKQGEAVALHEGVWHWVPYPKNSEHCKTLVIFKEGTSSNDCVIKKLDD
jgi:ureidoglycolate hydrolase